MISAGGWQLGSASGAQASTSLKVESELEYFAGGKHWYDAVEIMTLGSETNEPRQEHTELGDTVQPPPSNVLIRRYQVIFRTMTAGGFEAARRVRKDFLADVLASESERVRIFDVVRSHLASGLIEKPSGLSPWPSLRSLYFDLSLWAGRRCD